MQNVIDDSWYHRPDGVRVRTSAGGVVARVSGGRVLIGLVQEGEFPDYILPKGRLEPGEGIEAAALREIGEEAGLHDLRLLCPLGVRERLSFDKRWWIATHYFLFLTTEEDGHPTDVEHAYRLEWFPLEALPSMFWPEQRELVETHRRAIVRTVTGAAG